MEAVNRQIVKLFAFIVSLFAVLIGFTSYWSVFDAKALKEKTPTSGRCWSSSRSSAGGSSPPTAR